MRRILLAVSIASAMGVLEATSATGQAATKPAPQERTTEAPKIGTYDLELTTDGGTLIGELTLTRSGEMFAAALTAGGNKPQVKSFVREGHKYVLTGGHGTFVVVYELTFQHDSVVGSFQLSQGQGGKVAGALRK